MPGEHEALHIHLDPLGGLAGDMFIASITDAFPDLAEDMVAAAGEVAGVKCEFQHWRDGVITGRRFVVEDAAGPIPGLHTETTGGHHAHGDLHRETGSLNGHISNAPDCHGHPHTHWRDIRTSIERSSLASEVQLTAIEIFTHLAEAEARVHGVPASAVTFHEAGSTDSIADIVGAAYLISALHGATWSVSPLPLGGGTIQTAHGRLPVPAPAAALLLEGFEIIDDGIAGERVTPTGAAILRALKCINRKGLRGRLLSSGSGFGTRELLHTPNILRATVFSRDAGRESAQGHRHLGVIAFEVDDQTPEDMAIALERLRNIAGIHDVLQVPAFGKKGRLTNHIQVLANPDAVEDAIEACFHETATIGLRVSHVEGRALQRDVRKLSVEDRNITLKTVRRPNGVLTSKIEADDLRDMDGQAARSQLRRRAEHGSTDYE